MHKKYDIIVASKVLTKIENINEFLEIIKKVSNQNSRLIIFNKSFLYLTINSFFSKKKFNWLNTNELKTYLENFNFLFIRKLKNKIIPGNSSFSRFVNIILSLVPFLNILSSDEFTIFRKIPEAAINEEKGISICLTVKNEISEIIKTLLKKRDLNDPFTTSVTSNNNFESGRRLTLSSITSKDSISLTRDG